MHQIKSHVLRILCDKCALAPRKMLQGPGGRPLCSRNGAMRHVPAAARPARARRAHQEAHLQETHLQEVHLQEVEDSLI